MGILPNRGAQGKARMGNTNNRKGNYPWRPRITAPLSLRMPNQSDFCIWHSFFLGMQAGHAGAIDNSRQ